MATHDKEYRLCRISPGKSISKQTTTNPGREGKGLVFSVLYPAKLSFKKEGGIKTFQIFLKILENMSLVDLLYKKY